MQKKLVAEEGSERRAAGGRVEDLTGRQMRQSLLRIVRRCGGLAFRPRVVG